MAIPTQTIGGLASGMDTNSIITQLMGIEKTSLTKLQTKKEKENLYLQAYYSINTMLKDFLTAVQKVTSNSLWKTKATASSNEAILTAKATEAAAVGTHTFKVAQLATNAQYMSSGFASMDKAILPVGAAGQKVAQAANLYSKLTEMNGGNGVQNGVIQIDLRDSGGSIAEKAVLDADGNPVLDGDGNAVMNKASFQVNLVGCNTIGDIKLKIEKSAEDLGFYVEVVDKGDGSFGVNYAPVVRADCDLSHQYTRGTWVDVGGVNTYQVITETLTSGTIGIPTILNGQTEGSFTYSFGNTTYQDALLIPSHYIDATGKTLDATYVDDAGNTKFNFWLKNGAIVREEDMIASALASGNLKYINNVTYNDKTVFVNGDTLNAKVGGENKTLTYKADERKWYYQGEVAELDEDGNETGNMIMGDVEAELFSFIDDGGNEIWASSDRTIDGEVTGWRWYNETANDYTSFTVGGKTITAFPPHYEDLNGTTVPVANMYSFASIVPVAAAAYDFAPVNGEERTTTDGKTVTFRIDEGIDDGYWYDEDDNITAGFSFKNEDGLTITANADGTYTAGAHFKNSDGKIINHVADAEYAFAPADNETLTTTDGKTLTFRIAKDIDNNPLDDGFWYDVDDNLVDTFSFVKDGKTITANNDGTYTTLAHYEDKDGKVFTPDQYTYVAAGTNVESSGLFEFVADEHTYQNITINPSVQIQFDGSGTCTWDNTIVTQDAEGNYITSTAPQTAIAVPVNFAPGEIQSIAFSDVSGNAAQGLGLTDSRLAFGSIDANGQLKYSWAPGSAMVTDRGLEGFINLENAGGQAIRNVQVADLNGGAGIYHGSIQIVNQNGGGAIVDLSACVTLNDVLAKINGTQNVGVTAMINDKGDGIKLVDLTGGAGEMRVYNVGNGTTASDLGLTSMTRSGSNYTGTNINQLTETSPLSMLRNGLGINDGKLGNMIVNCGGKDYTVNAESCNTLGDLMWAIRNALNSDGKKLSENADIKIQDNRLVLESIYKVAVMSDTSADQSNTTAEDLGLATGTTAYMRVEGLALTSSLNSVSLYNVTGKRSFDATTNLASFGVNAGETLTVKDKVGGTSTFTATAESTLSDLLSFFNDDSNGANVLMYIDSDSGRLVFGDLTGNVTNDLVVSGSAAEKLGFGDGYNIVSGSTTGLRGKNIYSGGINGINDNYTRDAITGALKANLGTMKMTIGGVEKTLDLSTVKADSSMSDLVRTLNEQAQLNGANLTFKMNSANNGIEVVNNSGQNVVFSNGNSTTAADLGFANMKIVSGETANGGDLDTKWFTRSYAVEKLTGTKTMSGAISIVNSRGGYREIDLTACQTIGDVIDAINRDSSGINASINETGDGLILVDTLGGEGAISVSEVNGGSLAKQLGLLGSNKGFLNGSFERSISVAQDDSLRDVMNKIAASGLDVQCSIINDGAASAPYRLVINSKNSGSASDFILDTNVSSLAFKKTSSGQDAVLLYGQGEGGNSPTMLVSSTNTNNSAILGLTIDMKKVSDEWVTITVNQEKDQVTEAIKEMVSSYNAIVSLVSEYGKYTYNEETKKSEKGIFFGDNNVRNLINSIQQMFFTTTDNKSGGMSMWYDLGVKFTDNGTLSIDEDALASKIANNYDDVFNLLVKSVDVAATGMNASLSTSSAAATGFSKNGAANGNTNVKQFGKGNGFTAANPIGAGGYQYEVFFDTIRYLDKIYVHHVNTELMPSNKYALKDFKIEYLNPSTNKWEEMRAITDNTAAANYLGFGMTTAAKGVRIVANSTNATDGLFRLTELEAFESQGLASNTEKKLAALTDVIDGWFVGLQSNIEGRISSLDADIARKESQLETVETSLIRKYANMETVMAGLQAQSSYFSSMASSWAK